MSGAIAALAITVGTTAMGFIKAGKEKRAAEAAELSADIAMAEVEKALTKNEMDALSLQTEAYEREADALQSAASSELAAIREGDQRGVLAGSSRIQGGITEAAATSREGMAAELGDLEKLSADEATRKNDIGVQIKLGEAAGAQQAAAALSDSASAGNAAAMQGAASAAMQGASMATSSTYGKTKESRELARNEKDFKSAEKDKFLAGGGTKKEFRKTYDPNSYQGAVGKGQLTAEQFQSFGMTGSPGALGDDQFSNLDLEALSAMQPLEFKAELLKMTPAQRMMIQSMVMGK